MRVNGITQCKRQTNLCGVNLRGMAIARLLVSLAIVAIVGTVALPIARDHLSSSHTAQVIADLGAIEIAIGRFKTQNRGELPKSLDDLRIQQWLDPWGNAYQFRNLETATDPNLARKDYDSNQVNRDYDLFSTGEDGQSAPGFLNSSASDDVVRGLSGSYYGPVGDYPRTPRAD